LKHKYRYPPLGGERSSAFVSCPILFTHYGFSDYLPYTLACASETNQGTTRIFLGDELNRSVAQKHGWVHYETLTFASPKLEKFQSVFRHIRGRDHGVITNGQDWLRYVFARWFYLEEFLRRQKIERFWHFDTDTMILDDLRKWVDRINFDFTTQCNGTCLNGLIRTEVVSEFNDHTIRLFQTRDFLKAQEAYVRDHPGHSFNEMTAFHEYQKSSPCHGVHLMRWSETEVFDDYLRQDHGFEMHTLPTHDGKGCLIKMIRKDTNGFYGIRHGRRVRFLSLNLSHTNKALFKWVLASLPRPHAHLGEIRRSKTKETLKKIRAFFRQSISNLWLSKKKRSRGD
jgi:hypothetical protein